MRDVYWKSHTSGSVATAAAWNYREEMGCNLVVYDVWASTHSHPLIFMYESTLSFVSESSPAVDTSRSDWGQILSLFIYWLYIEAIPKLYTGHQNNIRDVHIAFFPCQLEWPRWDAFRLIFTFSDVKQNFAQ